MKSKVIIAIAAAAIVIGGGAAALYLTRDVSPTEVLSEEVGGFSGKVVDGTTGKPLPAEVFAKSGVREVQSVVCDSDGRFEFALKDGRYTVTANYEGYLARGKNSQARVVEVENSTQYVNAKLTLWPPASIKGRIASGNRGIQGEVQVIYQTDASGAKDYVLERIESNEEGEFEFSQAYAGIVNVSVEAEGFASVLLSDIVLQSGEMVDLGDIPLKDGVSIFGVVRDLQSKKGVSGANIKVLDASGKVLSETRSVSGGTYRLPAVDAKNVRFVAEAEGYHSFSGPMQLGKTLNREQNLDLKRAWGLSIEVVNTTNRAPIKTYVKIQDLSTNKVVYDEVRENGTFTLNDLNGGPYLVSASSYDKISNYEVRAVAGDSVRLLLKPYAKFNVQVVTRKDEPVKEGTWRYTFKPADGSDMMTSSWAPFEAEAFDIDELMPGSYRIEVRVNKDHTSSSPEIRVAMGDTKNIKIQLTEGGVLQGHVVSSGPSHRGVQAKVEWIGTNISTTTDSDGYFTLDQLPTRAIDIKISPNSGKEKTFTGITVAEDSTVEREFEVERTRRRPGADGDRPAPPWGDGAPPWGDGEPPRPPWGDGAPPWGDGEPPRPPWADGAPPWGDGEPPSPPNWGNGDRPAPPNWGNGDNRGNGEGRRQRRQRQNSDE